MNDKNCKTKNQNKLFYYLRILSAGLQDLTGLETQILR